MEQTDLKDYYDKIDALTNKILEIQDQKVFKNHLEVEIIH